MAVYAYQCKDCGREIEVEAPVSEGPTAPIACLNCLSLNIRRIWSAPAIQFVGGGWGCKP